MSHPQSAGAATSDRDTGLDWEQLGLPVAVISADGHVQRANRAFQMLLRSSASSEATSLDWLARFTPEARALLFTTLADRRADTPPLAWHGARGGALRWLAVTLKWRSAGTRCVATFHDVTLLRQAELQARERAEQLRVMCDTAPTMLAAFDAQTLRCEYANRTLSRTFGVDPQEVVGRSMAELLGADFARELEEDFTGDLRHSKEITPEAWAHRGIQDRARESLARAWALLL